VSLGAWLTVRVAAGLAVLTIAVAGCHQHKESLVLSPPLQKADEHLLAAAQRGDLALVKAALAEGANVNCRSTNGLTPLLQTVGGVTAPYSSGRRECVSFLLAQRAAVDARDLNGQPALTHAARSGDLETVQLLVEAGAFIKARDWSDKTPMLYAAESGHRNIVEYLGMISKTRGKASVW
jgi:ankyrin repeat protein